MGRKKITIQRIGDERNRQVTFTKRKFGLMKKAYELSVLCECEIAVIIFNGNQKLFQYASSDMDHILLKYTDYNEPHESRTNADIVDSINKKEAKGGSADSDDDGTLQASFVPTPNTRDEWNKIDEEFSSMIHQQPDLAGSSNMRPSPLHLPRNQPHAQNTHPRVMPVSQPVAELHGNQSNAGSMGPPSRPPSEFGSQAGSVSSPPLYSHNAGYSGGGGPMGGGITSGAPLSSPGRLLSGGGHGSITAGRPDTHFVLPPTSSPLIRNSHGHGAISPTGSNVSVSPGPSNHGNHGNHGSHSIQPPVPHPHSAGRAMGHKPHLKVKIPSQNQTSMPHVGHAMHRPPVMTGSNQVLQTPVLNTLATPSIPSNNDLPSAVPGSLEDMHHMGVAQPTPMNMMMSQPSNNSHWGYHPSLQVSQSGEPLQPSRPGSTRTRQSWDGGRGSPESDRRSVDSMGPPLKRTRLV